MTSTVHLQTKVFPSYETSREHLKVITIPEEERILPTLNTRLVEPISGLAIPGVFTEEEAAIIVAQSLHFDWRLIPTDQKIPSRTPNCAYRLLKLIEEVLAAFAPQK